jgi:hypothetical protein
MERNRTAQVLELWRQRVYLSFTLFYTSIGMILGATLTTAAFLYMQRGHATLLVGIGLAIILGYQSAHLTRERKELKAEGERIRAQIEELRGDDPVYAGILSEVLDNIEGKAP